MTRGIALCCIVLAGCATFGNSGASAKLQRGFTVASQRAALAEARVEELEARLQRLESQLKAQEGTASEVDSDLERDVAAVRALLEELQFSMDGLRSDFDAYVIDQERRQLHDETRLSQLEELLAVETPPAPDLSAGTSDAMTTPETDDPGETPTGETSSEAVGEGAAEQLAIAEDRMAAGQQAAARSILQRLLDAQPDDPLVPEIRYRLAETLYNEGKYREAARSFQVVTDKHGSSPWAPWAMFRIGECFVGMERPDAAEAFFDGVIRNFPNTDAAKEASTRLGR
jgi:TolA-binding protein